MILLSYVMLNVECALRAHWDKPLITLGVMAIKLTQMTCCGFMGGCVRSFLGQDQKRLAITEK